MKGWGVEAIVLGLVDLAASREGGAMMVIDDRLDQGEVDSEVQGLYKEGGEGRECGSEKMK